MSISPDLVTGGPSPVTLANFARLALGAWGNPSIIRTLLGRAFAQVEAARAAQVVPIPAPVPVLPPVEAVPTPPPVIALPPPLLPLPPLAPTPPLAPLPTGGDILGELLNRPHVSRPVTINPDFERLLRKAPETDFERLLRGTFKPGGGAVSRVLTGTARVLGSGAVSVLGGVLWPSPLGGEDIISAREAARRGTPRPARGPKRRPKVRPRAPLGAIPAPSPVGTAVPLPQPAAPTAPQPSLTPIDVRARPVRIDRPARAPTHRPIPAPRPTAAPRPSPFPYLVTLALPYLLSGSGRPRPQTITRFQPGPGSDTLSPFQPGPGLPAPLPQPIPLPITAPLTGFQPGTLPLRAPPPEDPCKCATSRKPKKPRKPREICYAGEYRERRTGLSKERLRKIPCQ